MTMHLAPCQNSLKKWQFLE